MNRKFNRVYVLSASLLASLVLLNLPFTVNASSLLQDESVSYIEYETDSVGELDLPEYDSVESAINDKSLISFDDKSFNVSSDDEYVHYNDGDKEQDIDLTENFNEEIGLTDEEIKQIYEKYLIEESISYDERLTVNDFEKFTDYAVKNNIIENTVEAKAALTKSTVRTNLRIVAHFGGLAGYTVAKKLLLHSLQDNPRSLYFEGTGDSTVKKVVQSPAFKSIYESYKGDVRNKPIFGYGKSGSTTLASPKDLHLALNKVKYNAIGYSRYVKILGKKRKIWRVKFTFTDRYDFEVQAWKNAMTSSNVVTLLNNYAAYGQKIGAVVPYDIKIQFNMTFAE